MFDGVGVVKLVVGLGNPGKRYDGTRHNVGFDVVDLLASRWQASMLTEKFHAWFGDADCSGERVVLLKPTTWMNRSGQAVAAAGRFYKLELADLLIVADDLALPLGRIRFRSKGSAGSHNGLQDVIDRIGTNEFCRLRVGIDKPVGVPSVYVTSRFTEAEELEMVSSRKCAADAVEHWIHHGPESTMNRFNSDPVEP